MAAVAQTLVGQVAGAAATQAPAREAGTGGAGGRAPQLPALTGVRFIAALLVVCTHYGGLHVQAASALGRVAVAFADSVSDAGFLGVDIFFMLSGFILTWSCLGARGELRGGLGRFWWARFSRIYPLYLLAFGAAAPVFFWQPAQGSAPAPVAVAAADLLLVQAWLPGCAIAWNGPGWSLSAEAFFYALFPLLARALVRQDVRRLVALAVLAWALCVLSGLVYLLLRPDGPAALAGWTDGVGQRVLAFNPLLHLPEFALGMAAGRLFVLGYRLPRGLAALALPVALIGLCSAGAVPWPLLRAGLLDLPCAVLLYEQAGARGRAARVLGSRPLVRLGEASYALYLLQAPVWSIVRRLVGLPPWAGITSWGELAYCALSCGLLLALALLAHDLVERPTRRALMALGPRRVLVGVRIGRRAERRAAA